MKCEKKKQSTNLGGAVARTILATSCSLCVVVSGCAGRNLGDIPAANAPLEERVEAYERLRFSSLESVTYRPQGAINLGTPPPDEYVLELANGARIKNPTRLLKFVFPDSKTAREAKLYQGIARKERISYGAAGASVGLGLGFVALGLPIGERESSKGLIITGVVLSVAAIIPLLIGRHFGKKSNVHSYEAFRTYDRDLRRRLRIRSNPDAYRYE